jgi:hypothetical protein
LAAKHSNFGQSVLVLVRFDPNTGKASADVLRQALGKRHETNSCRKGCENEKPDLAALEFGDLPFEARDAAVLFFYGPKGTPQASHPTG